VLGRGHPVGVDRAHVLRVGFAAPASEELRGRDLALGHLRLGNGGRAAPRGLRDDRERSRRQPSQVVADLLGLDVDELGELPLRPERGETRLQVGHDRPARILELDVLRPRHPRLEALVHEQAPDLLERIATDELLDVDTPIAKRATLLVGLGDRRLESNDTLEPRPDLVHELHGTAAGLGNAVDIFGAIAHRVTLIPGDGIGPELTEATRRVLEATGVAFEWDVQEAGAEVMAAHDGNPLPHETLASIRRNGVALKGPITTPIGEGFRSVNVGLRTVLDLYAQVRPCKTYPGVRTRYENVDLVIVRETTEDIYAGIEFEEGTPAALELAEWLADHGEKLPQPDSGLSIKPISITGSRRVFQFAFDYARRMGRRKVTCVHKANIMKFTDGLWLRTARKVAEDNTDIEFDDRIADNMCMQLVQHPEDYDVLVLPNLYGDIISDLAAGLIGGLGVAPGANFGDRVAVFEPTHGSAPKYAGQNKANPIAQMLSGMLMLHHIGEHDAGVRLERAIAELIREGESVTYDMKPTRDDPTAVGTSDVADALISKLQA
jgi:isocitrate dehydrogenase (NAD+)